MRRIVLTCCAALLAAATLHAQSFTTSPCTDKQDGDHWFLGSSHACEVRSATLPLADGNLKLNDTNGSIEVTGEDRQDIALEARVTVRANSQGEADSLLHQIAISTSGTIQATGPKPADHRGWSVNYRLRVPHRLAATLQTVNGSLTLTALDGNIQAETTNGSLKLADLAGDVHASTTNGSIKATLAGSTWQGSGLSATTTNGAVAVSLPPAYSAHLVASTVNGGLSAPNGAQPTGRKKELNTTLGSGGPTLTFETTNGGISIN